MTPTNIPELVRRLRDYQPTLTEGVIIHSRETVEQAAELLWAMAADLAMTTDYKDARIAQLEARCEKLAGALDHLTQWEGHHVYCGHGKDDSKPCVCGFNGAYETARQALEKDAS